MFEAFKFIAMLCGIMVMLSGTTILVLIATKFIEDWIEDYMSSEARRGWR